jgi:hypothetical protein
MMVVYIIYFHFGQIYFVIHVFEPNLNSRPEKYGNISM